MNTIEKNPATPKKPAAQKKPARPPLLELIIGWGCLFILIIFALGLLDFAIATLLGVLLVIANLAWTEKIVLSLLTKSKRSAWLWSYPLKLIFNLVYLATCLRFLDVSPLGLLLGTSTILPACLTLALCNPRLSNM